MVFLNEHLKKGGFYLLQTEDNQELLPLPVRLQVLIKERVSRLEPNVQAVLDVASVIGREVDRKLLSQVFVDDCESAVESLVTNRWLEETANDNLRFVHDKLREVPYAALQPDERSSRHRQIASLLENSERDSLGTRAAHAGRHWAHANEPSKAAPLLAEAGDSAKESFANQRAIALYESAAIELAKLSDPSAELKLHIPWRLGETLARIQVRDRAEENYRCAISLVKNKNKVIHSKLLHDLGRIKESLFDYPAALSAFDEAALNLEAIENRSPHERDTWLRIMLSKFWIKYWKSDIPAMEEIIEQITPILSKSQEPELITRYYLSCTLLGFRRTNYAMDEYTVQAAQNALRLAQQGHLIEQRIMANCVNGLICLFSTPEGENHQAILKRQLQDAEAYLESAQELAMRCGAVFQATMTLSYLGLVARRLGDMEATTRHTDKLLQRAGDGMLGMWAGLGHANRAWMALRQNNRDAVLDHVECADAIWSKMPVRYAFLWSAYLPKLTIELGRNLPWEDTVEAMIGAKVHRLPDLIRNHLVSACELKDSSSDDAKEHLWDAVDAARSLRFI